MTSLIKFFSALCLGLSLTACQITAPNYNPPLEQITSAQKNVAQPSQVGAFSVADAKLETISIRTNPLQSPIEKSFAAYLREALKQELILAKKYDAQSPFVLEGTILDQDLEAGFDKGLGKISVAFVLKKSGQVVFKKTLNANHEWPSAFIGSIAIPAAAENYPVLVSKVIRALWEDPDFKKAFISGANA